MDGAHRTSGCCAAARSTQYDRPEGCALIFAETNAAELTDASNDVMSCEQSAARHVATPRLRTACVSAGAARACHTAAKCAAAPRNTSRAVLHASTTMLRRRARRTCRRNERRGAAGCTPHCRTAALEPRHGILHALGFRQLDCIYVQVGAVGQPLPRRAHACMHNVAVPHWSTR